MQRLRFWDGARAFFGGIGFVASRPSVWPLAAVPAAMVLVLVTGFGVLGLWASWKLAAAVLSGGGAWVTAGRWFLELVLGSVALVSAAVLGLVLAQPLSSPALDAISERQGAALGRREHERQPLAASMKRSLAVNLLGLAVWAPLYVVLTVVELAAPPAVVVTWPLKFVLSALLLVWQLIDYPLGLHGVALEPRLRFFGRNFWPLLLFGSFSAVGLLVPGLGLLLLPFGVAGATRLVADGV